MNERSRARVGRWTRVGAALLCAAVAGFPIVSARAGGGAEARATAPPAPQAATPGAGAVPAPLPGTALAGLPPGQAPRAPHPPRTPRDLMRGMRERDRDDDDDAPRVSIDTLLVVQPGMRLAVFNFGGSVAFRTWPRNQVRMAVERAAQDRVAIVRAGHELKLESVSAHGMPGDMDFSLTVPPWLPVALTGVNSDVTAEGLTGGLQVETVHGDVVVRRVTGPVGLHSVEGVVDLANARGRIDVGSVNDAVRLLDVSGEISADAINGDVHLVDVDSRKVEATSISGDVIYDSPILDGGSYSFSTHDGDIAVGLSAAPNATVNVSTFSGDFASAFDIRPQRSPGGKRLHFTMGNGGARVNLESFQGSIEILKRSAGELQKKMNDARKARRDALLKWGEWNPTRREELKIERVHKHEKQRVEERAASHRPNDADPADGQR